MGTPHLQALEQTSERALLQCLPPELRQPELRLPGVHRTHRKRRNHQDSHDVMNNILAW
jgi:hypothetical protein